MKADLVRLGHIAAAGSRVIIFETPIAPHLVGEVLARRSAQTTALRAEFMDACHRHGLICVPPPAPVAGEEYMMWTSGSHAPPAILGRYIAGLL